jgi:hypothetical protein
MEDKVKSSQRRCLFEPSLPHSTVLDFFFGRSVGKADWEKYGAANLRELLMAEMIICPTED